MVDLSGPSTTMTARDTSEVISHGTTVRTQAGSARGTTGMRTVRVPIKAVINALTGTDPHGENRAVRIGIPARMIPVGTNVRRAEIVHTGRIATRTVRTRIAETQANRVTAIAINHGITEMTSPNTGTENLGTTGTVMAGNRGTEIVQTQDRVLVTIATTLGRGTETVQAVAPIRIGRAGSRTAKGRAEDRIVTVAASLTIAEIVRTVPIATAGIPIGSPATTQAEIPEGTTGSRATPVQIVAGRQTGPTMVIARAPVTVTEIGQVENRTGIAPAESPTRSVPRGNHTGIAPTGSRTEIGRRENPIAIGVGSLMVAMTGLRTGTTEEANRRTVTIAKGNLRIGMTVVIGRPTATIRAAGRPIAETVTGSRRTAETEEANRRTVMTVAERGTPIAREARTVRAEEGKSLTGIGIPPTVIREGTARSPHTARVNGLTVPATAIVRARTPKTTRVPAMTPSAGATSSRGSATAKRLRHVLG